MILIFSSGTGSSRAVSGASCSGLFVGGGSNRGVMEGNQRDGFLDGNCMGHGMILGGFSSPGLIVGKDRSLLVVGGDNCVVNGDCVHKHCHGAKNVDRNANSCSLLGGKNVFHPFIYIDSCSSEAANHLTNSKDLTSSFVCCNNLTVTTNGATHSAVCCHSSGRSCCPHFDASQNTTHCVCVVNNNVANNNVPSQSKANAGCHGAPCTTGHCCVGCNADCMQNHDNSCANNPCGIGANHCGTCISTNVHCITNTIIGGSGCFVKPACCECRHRGFGGPLQPPPEESGGERSPPGTPYMSVPLDQRSEHQVSLFSII